MTELRIGWNSIKVNSKALAKCRRFFVTLSRNKKKNSGII